MEIKLNDKFFIKSYDSKVEYKKTILNYILESKSNKILYKGNLEDINYKLLKKIFNNQMNINGTSYRNYFLNYLKNLNIKENCIIIKK